MAKKNRRIKSKFNLMIIVFACVFVSLCLNVSKTHAAALSEMRKFPSKPIRIIVPGSAGGSLGNEIRMIAPFLQKNLGVTTVIEYVEGAAGIIAYNKFYKEKPDGYTILSFNLLSPITLELTRENAKFVIKNLSSIAAWNVKNFVLVVDQDGWKTFDEFLKDAKRRKISIASTGGGLLQGQIMENALGLKFNWVPYSSAGEGLAAVAGKHVDMVLTSSASPKPLIRAGKVRVLAVFSSKPDSVLPGAPNFKELGHGEVPLLGVQGMFAAPPNTPQEIVRTFEKAIRNSIVSAELNDRAEAIGVCIDFKAADEVKKMILEYYELLDRYKKFINPS